MAMGGMGAVLGFDEQFDGTAADTRRRGPARIAMAGLVFVTALPSIPLHILATWAVVFAVGDLALWFATGGALPTRRPVLARGLRLGATLISTSAWVTIGALWWAAPGPAAKAVAVALIGGVLLYMVRGCFRSLIHMLATGAPPAAALLVLPFTAPRLADRAGLLGALSLLVLYAFASALNAWRTHRDLERTTRQLIDKQREAEAASIAKSEFLANMSHEIRTPLNGVVAMAHVLHEADLAPREKEAARLICASGETLERLLSDILDLAKVEAGQMEVETAPFHLGDLARNAAALCRTKAEEKGVRLLVEVRAGADQTFDGDAVRLRQILMNLMSNSVKFTAAGEVRLVVETRGADGVRCTVRDTGVGFDPEQKARIFDRFQQADGSITRRFGGTGLGLAISRGLAEMMGGTLDCDGAPGQGAAFWLDLPLAIAAGAVCAGDAGAAQPDAGLRLLAADDNPTNLKVIQIILEGAGVQVDCAADGEAAVEAHARQAYDLILMDMQMPIMDGLTATRAIRAREAQTGGRRTPVIMLTANALPEHVRAGQLAGADAHLCKPITPASLFACMSEALDDAQPAVEAPQSAA